MQIIFLVGLVVSILSGRVHIVKIEPYEMFEIKAPVAGRVEESKTELEGKRLKGVVVVKLEDRLDRLKLSSLKKRLLSLEKRLKITSEKIKTAQRVMEIKRDNFYRIKPLRSKSLVEKERKEVEFLNAKTSLLNLKELYQNLKSQIATLEYEIQTTEDRLEKKNLKATGYLYRVKVKKGDFVTAGKPLYTLADISKGKITLYLEPKEINRLDSILIEGKKEKVKIESVDIISDPTYLTLYRVKLTLPAPNYFGKLIKVEIKE